MTKVIPQILEFDAETVLIRNVSIRGELRITRTPEGALTLDTTRADFYPLTGELRYLPLTARKR